MDVSDENPEVFENMKREMINLHQEIVEEAIDWRDFSWTNN